MCGIIGVLGEDRAAPRLLESLKRLEYRGYDSAGIATLNGAGLKRLRAEGKLENLAAALSDNPVGGSIGIGHTRWATHGPATEANAHPHRAAGVAVVHNGIIENFQTLRAQLVEQGRAFASDTDTETVAHLISVELGAGKPPVEAVRAVLPRLEGAFALAMIFDEDEDLMIGARKGSPLVLGVGEGEMYLGSDALAVAPFTDQVVYLEEGDWCVVHRRAYEIFDAAGARVERPVVQVRTEGFEAEKGNYAHFMQKEIFEQGEAANRTLTAYVDSVAGTIALPETAAALDFETVSAIQMVACGTANYAAMTAAYWFEQIAGLPARTDIASEFRYRKPVLPEGGLALFISQSGETADTLAALRYCRKHGQTTAGLVNVPTSTIAREADVVLPTRAGPEIGVASTKAFTAQLSALAAIALVAGKARGRLSAAREAEYVKAFSELPRLIGETLELDSRMAGLAQGLAQAGHVLYVGRGAHYPLALEGALKFKEITYIPAEGFASGELKHGSIALVDESTPVVFVAPYDELFEKSISNLQEVAARKGRVILITDKAGAKAAAGAPAEIVETPTAHPLLTPILQAVPLQLLAYHAAVARGADVDQPRNLAKSVTVE
ncbi:MAG: glutamine--fructose-6-phosphate transaminase (isomerizing) [Pseudomonadota bacterium]